MAASVLIFAAQPAMALAQTVSQKISASQSSPVFVPASTSGTSANWAGYVAQGSGYSAVSGSWVVPTVSAASVETAADATWVGIGGVQSKDLIQAGTQAIVENGSVQYEAWYELLPEYQTQISLAVHAGDSVSVSLAETSTNNWSLTFLNNTSGQIYQKNITYTSSHSSAEWIEEMPVGGTGRVPGYLPLDSFGNVQFTNANAIVNGVQKNISSVNAQALTMVANGIAIASTSSIGADGKSFGVARTSAAVTETNQYTQTSGRGWSRNGNGVQGFTRVGRNVGTTTTSTTTKVQQIIIPLSFLHQMGKGSRMRFIFLRR